MIQDYVDHFAVRNAHGKTVRDEQGRTFAPTVILGDWSRVASQKLAGTPPLRHVGPRFVSLEVRMPVYLIPEFSDKCNAP